MRTYLLVLGAILLAASANAQTDSSIIGTWQLVTLSNKEMYYDLAKDSLFLSEESKKEIGTNTEHGKVKEALYSVFKGVDIHFHLNGSFRQTLKGEDIFDGTYEVFSDKEMIELRLKGEGDVVTTQLISYKLKQDYLWLFFSAKENSYDFLLKKR